MASPRTLTKLGPKPAPKPTTREVLDRETNRAMAQRMAGEEFLIRKEILFLRKRGWVIFRDGRLWMVGTKQMNADGIKELYRRTNGYGSGGVVESSGTGEAKSGSGSGNRAKIRAGRGGADHRDRKATERSGAGSLNRTQEG